MGNMGFGEIAVLMILALIVFGPDKLPTIARNVGKALRAFQTETNKAAETLRSAVESEQRTSSTGVIDRPDGHAEQPKPDTTPPAHVPRTPLDAGVTVADAAEQPPGRAYEDT